MLVAARVCMRVCVSVRVRERVRECAWLRDCVGMRRVHESCAARAAWCVDAVLSCAGPHTRGE